VIYVDRGEEKVEKEQKKGRENGVLEYQRNPEMERTFEGP